MIFNEFVFVPATPTLLNAPNSMESALHIARQKLELEPVFLGMRCYADIVPKNIGIATLSQLVHSSPEPMDSVLPVSVDSEEIAGWYVCLWYNEDDLDDDYDEGEE